MSSNVCAFTLSDVLHDLFSGSRDLDVFGVSQRTRVVVVGSNPVTIAKCAFGFILVCKARWATGRRVRTRTVIARDGINNVG